MGWADKSGKKVAHGRQSKSKLTDAEKWEREDEAKRKKQLKEIERQDEEIEREIQAANEPEPEPEPKQRKGRKTKRARLEEEVEKNGYDKDAEGNFIGPTLVKSPSLGFVGEQIRSVIDGSLDSIMAGHEGDYNSAIESGFDDANTPSDSQEEINIQALSACYVDTPYMKVLYKNKASRHWYRHARTWRPIFLAALTLSPFIKAALRKAGAHFGTYQLHYSRDPVFRSQVDHCISLAKEMLHMSAWRKATEGVLEPVIYQGVTVSYVRKMDTKMHIELLRAHLPEMFKTPMINAKTDVTVNANHTTNNNTVVVTPERLSELQERRKAALTGRKPPTTIDIETEKK